MPLETATYVVSLVITNPDGSDQKNTADDHIRLLKACLKRSFPLIDGAVSLSHTQLMRLNDVSQSVQLQFNNLRDGSATAVNALYANSASFASIANNALSLGGVAAAQYVRRDAPLTISAAVVIAQGADNFIQLGATGSIEIARASAGDGVGGFIDLKDSGSDDFDVRIASTNTRGLAFTVFGSFTINGNTIWHAGNDGEGSGLDAALMDGRAGSETIIASSVVYRTAQGYINAVYFNQASPENENPNVGSVAVFAPGDNYFRKATLTYLGSLFSTRNISNKAGTAKTLSSSAPSGGSDGDIWYRI